MAELFWCLSVGVWAQTWQELCKGCPWLSQLPSVLPGASSRGAASWLWCWSQQPAHLQHVPWRLCHLSSTSLGLCMGRSGRDELRLKREYTLVWESPKCSQKWDGFWKRTLEIPFCPYRGAARLESGIQDWTYVTLSLAVPALCQIGSLPWCCLIFEQK